MKVQVPYEDLQGLLSAIEDFFGPEVFEISTSTEKRIVNLHKYGRTIKELLNEKTEESDAEQVASRFSSQE